MPDPNSNVPNIPDTKKKRIGRPKKVEEVQEVPASVPPPADTDEAFLNKLLHNAIAKYSEQIQQEQRDYREDVEAIIPIVSEFLDDFCIIGHTVTGQRVILKYAPSQRAYDCLENVIKDFVMQYVQPLD